MENIIVIDSMVKESKIWKTPMIIFYVLATIFPCVLIWNEIKITEFVLCEVFLILLGSYFLYGYLFSYKYRLIVSNEKIVLKTLFRKIEINICNIEKYTCKRYRKSVFYQFRLFIKDKHILVNTRYKEEFESILKDNSIEQIIK